MLRMLNGVALAASRLLRDWRVRLGHYLLRDQASYAGGEGRPLPVLPDGLEKKLRQPGLDCPVCNALIPISTGNLLARAPVKCAACGLELTLDNQASADSLAALRRHLSRLDDIETQALIAGASVRRE